MESRTPAQLYALVVGVALVAVGIVGFFYSAAFGTPGEVSPVLGLLDVNGWHNVVHLATGALGLAAVGSAAYARTYALALGVVYIVVAVWGFVIGSGEAILTIVPVNTADNFLHLAIGVLGLATGTASGQAEETATAG
jgi:Domain of unknown function (DUF4383)